MVPVNSKRLVTLFVVLCLVAGVQTSAYAGLTDIPITGVVTDKVGRPLVGVLVTDGNRSSWTDAGGSYTINQSLAANFTLSASKSGLVATSKSGSAFPGTVLDFDLYYVATGTLGRTSVSTASGPIAETLTVTSWAPNPATNMPGGTGETCVGVVDAIHGSESSAVFVGTDPQGKSTWVHELHIDQGSAEGRWDLDVSVQDCGSDTALSKPSTTPFKIDNTPPELDARAIFPGVRGNTIFNPQTIGARIVDAPGTGISRSPSGIDPATIVIRLTEENGSVTTFSGNQIAYSASIGWASVAQVPLVVGKVYSVAISASDQAGNFAQAAQGTELGGGFLATHLELNTTTAHIDEFPCQIQGPAGIGFVEAVCEDVPVDFDSTTVTMSGSRNSGLGGFVQTAPLTSAELVSSVQPIPWGVSGNCLGGCESVNHEMHFTVPTSTSSSQILQVERSHAVRTIKVKVPSFWSDASIRMAGITTSVSHSACSNPIGNSGKCSPDPVQGTSRDYSHASAPGGSTKAVYTWVKQSPSVSPAGRGAHTMVMDSVRSQAVLFGGRHLNGYDMNDTWTTDGANWTQKCATCSPAPRDGHSMAFDGARSEVVVFGGTLLGPPRSTNETWVWNGSSWTQRFPTTSPPARTSASMVYDPIRQQVVLFGGDGGTAFVNGEWVTVKLNDTWVWQGNNWEQKFPSTRPTGRQDASMAFDPARGQTVLFGGYGVSGVMCGMDCGSSWSWEGGTWLWDGSNWTKKAVPNSPGPRYGSHMAYLGSAQEIVLFGGCVGTKAWQCSNTNDLWSWNGTVWKQEMINANTSNQPPARYFSAFVSHPTANVAVLFGGINQTYMSDTWNLGASTDNMFYHGGQIVRSPKVYVTYWGWKGTDPSGQKVYMENFFNGIGGHSYLSATTQYSEIDRGFITNPTSLLKGTWNDDYRTPRPASACPSLNCRDMYQHINEEAFYRQVHEEVIRAKDHFGGYIEDAVYVIALPKDALDGASDGWSKSGGTGWCASHGRVLQGGLKLKYIVIPYMSDSSGCGKNSVNSGSSGTLDGVGIVTSHEYVETLTDPHPSVTEDSFLWWSWQNEIGSWYSGTAQDPDEAGDKCNPLHAGKPAAHNMTLTNGTVVVVQKYWSNAFSSGRGGCVSNN